MKKPNFKVGDKVFAKVKGYPPWPAHIVGETGKKYNVKFYGTGEIGLIKIEDLFYYLSNKAKYRKPLKRKDYVDAFAEIEEAIERDGGDGNTEDNGVASESDTSANITVGSLNSSIKTTKKTSLKRKKSHEKSSLEPPEKSANVLITDDGDNDVESTSIGEPEEQPVDKSLELQPLEDLDIKDVEIKEETIAVLGAVEEAKSVESKVKDERDFAQVRDSTEIYIVSEKTLRNNIAYRKYALKYEEENKVKPPEPRIDYISQVFPVKLPSGKMGGIKLHLKWPLKFENEHNRAIYDEATALRVLEEHKKVLSGDLTITNDKDAFIADIKMTEDEVKEKVSDEERKNNERRLKYLRTELDLRGLDCKIKNCLGLEEANPKEALVYLQKMCDMDFEEIMLKKHPSVVEVVRRLRKYVGNTQEWDMSQQSLEEFESYAAKVRDTAESLYYKFKKVVQVPENSASFWEGFTEVITKFVARCADWSQSQVLSLTAEPGSRQAFIDMQEKELSEKENVSGIANADAETEKIPKENCS